MIWLVLASCTLSSPAGAEGSGLVVHEWGTFTTVSGRDGVALEWSPLDGPSDLPPFVYTDARPGLRDLTDQPTGKGRSTVRMETPVLYFHTDHPLTARVRVGFPEGRVTEWYPKALSVDGGIDWGVVKLLPDVAAAYPHDGKKSHYYPARNVDAATVRVCDAEGLEHERFLFYRGVGDFQPAVTFTLEGDRIAAKGPPRQVIVFERQGDRMGHVVGSTSAPLARPALTDGVDATVADLERLLKAEGLYDDEVRAMTDTWRDDWFEDGLRVLWLYTAAETEAVLPLEVSPAPKEVVRVLVGRTELVTPEQAAEALDIWTTSPDEDAARAALTDRFGRFGDPVLQVALSPG
jgi:hypothetical protein